MPLQVARTAAVKKPRRRSEVMQDPGVTISQLPRELRELLPYHKADRVQVLNANTVIVWNSVEQRRRLQGKVR